MDEDPDVVDVLRAIVTGTPVDWAAIESEHVEASFGAALRDLKLISQIADFHRGLPESVAPPSVDGSPASVEDAGRRTWGSLALLECIGQGAFGAVHRAWDSRLDREVALKLLRQLDASHTLSGSTVVQEGRLLARLRHPNIVTVYGADVVEGHVGIWMEFVQGRTLDAIVRERGPFDASETIAIGLTVNRALCAVHRAGLVHRDIKAQNVMRENDGRIVLMDFGTGQEIGGATAGELAGTPVYVAPELLDGAPADAQSDVYSLGVLLFYLATGSYPVDVPTVAQLRQVHTRKERRRLHDIRPDLPHEFVTVVERATAPDRHDRYDSAMALDEALSAMIERTTAVALPARAADAVVAGRPARATLPVALVIGVAILTAAGSFAWRRSSDRRARPDRQDSVTAPLAIAVGPAVRRAEVPGFIATSEPSRTGRWLGGVDWNADGNLAVLDVFTGARRVLTSKSDESGEFTDGSAISADEQLIAYSWYRTARQDSSELRTIGVDGSNPRLIARHGEGILVPVGWAPDGRRVLVVQGRSAAADLVWVDTRDGTVARLATLSSVPRDASLSPDGALVAFDLPSSSDAAERDLYVCEAATGRVTPLLVHPANDLAPVWVPNGAGVAFTSNRGGNLGLWFVPVTRAGAAAGEPTLVRGDMGRFAPIGFGRDAALFYRAVTGTVDVYVATIDLQTAHLSAPEIAPERFMGMNLFSDWSPDGRSLVFTSRRGEVGFEPRSQVLVTRDLTTKNERVVTPGLSELSWPRWSPDGQSLVVKGNGPLGSGLYRVSLRDGSISPLVIRDGLLNFPEWQPDGREVLFVVAPGRVRAVDVTTKAERPVLEGAFAYALSRDGRQLAFARRKADSVTIYVAPANGGTPRAILTLSGNIVVELAGWSAGGTEVVVTHTERPPQQHPAEIIAVPVTGGSPRQISTLPLQGARSFRLSPDGMHLAFEAGYPSSSMWVLERFINR